MSNTPIFYRFTVKQVSATQEQVAAAVAALQPPPDTYMAGLRTELRLTFAKIPAADQPRFFGVYTDIQAAFDMHQPAAFIRGMISNVYIGMGGEDDEENRPDLNAIKQEMLSLPEWP